MAQRLRASGNKTQRRKEAKDAKIFNTEAQWHTGSEQAETKRKGAKSAKWNAEKDKEE